MSARRRLIRRLRKSDRGPSIQVSVDYTADEPLVHYSVDGRKTLRIATVREFEIATGCTISFTEGQA